MTVETSETNETIITSKPSEDGQESSDGQTSTANNNTGAEEKGQEKKDSTLLGEEKAPEKVVPETYETFKMPEGYEFNEELLGEFSALSKELGLAQDDAQKLVDIGNKNMETVLSGQAEAWTKVREGWVSSLKEDSEFGGEKFSETVTRAQRSLKKFGDKGLTSMLDQTGYGDNPEIIKLLARIDKAIGEDNSVSGKPVGSNAGKTTARS